MKLKRINIVYILAIAMLTCMLGLLSVFAACDRRERNCKDIRISFSDDRSFISEEEVINLINTHYGAWVGQRLDSIRLDRIEELLCKRSAIRSSEAWTSNDGYLDVRIARRKPIVRFQNGMNGFYADDEAMFFPLNSSFCADVPIIDGKVPVGADEQSQSQWLKRILAMLSYMDRKGWADKMVQIHVESDGNIIMIPREGKERFIFGDPRNYEDKFARMEDYYRYIRNSEGGGKYSSVNLKHAGQIICK